MNDLFVNQECKKMTTKVHNAIMDAKRGEKTLEQMSSAIQLTVNSIIGSPFLTVIASVSTTFQRNKSLYSDYGREIANSIEESAEQEIAKIKNEEIGKFFKNTNDRALAIANATEKWDKMWIETEIAMHKVCVDVIMFPTLLDHKMRDMLNAFTVDQYEV